MDPVALRYVGSTELAVTRLGFGGVPLGDPDGAVDESQATATLDAVYAAGIRFFDTAPWYGNTKSEHRMGHFLRSRPRESFALSTKVGRVYFRPRDVRRFADSPWVARWPGGLSFDLRFDYTRAGVERSYQDSLMRLGMNTVDALVIHDLDFKHQKTEEGVQRGFRELGEGGGFAALSELKKRGEIKAIGAGVNHMGMIPRFLEHFDMDYFLVAMPYTLLDQAALDQELPLCQERNVGIVIGAVFASGILATGPNPDARYGYLPADADVLDRVRRMAEVCHRHGTPLAAAALQFPLGHPSVASVIPGANSAAQVKENVANMSRTIPADLWSELVHEGLLRSDAPTPP
jgi:D-threo-aldose 1-dehydrogenase